MALRSTMAPLIAETRRLIGDPAGASEVFSDADIQDSLDRRRRDISRLEMIAVSTVAVGGITSYLDYYTDGGHWEQDAVLQDPNFKVLTTSTSPVAITLADYLTGRWTLSASQDPPVIITGKQFDLNGAAADLLEEWLSRVKLEFDFLSAGRTFKRSQQIDALLSLSERYRRRQWIGYSAMVRTDMNA